MNGVGHSTISLESARSQPAGSWVLAALLIIGSCTGDDDTVGPTFDAEVQAVLELVPAGATSFVHLVDADGVADPGPMQPSEALAGALRLDDADAAQLDDALAGTRTVLRFGALAPDDSAVLAGRYELQAVGRGVLEAVGSEALAQTEVGEVLTLRWPDGSGVAITPTEVLASPDGELLEQLIQHLQTPGTSLADTHPRTAVQVGELRRSGADTISTNLVPVLAEPHRMLCGLGCTKGDAESLIHEIDDELVGKMHHRHVAFGWRPDDDHVLVLFDHDNSTAAEQTLAGFTERIAHGRQASAASRPWGEPLSIESIEQTDRFVVASACLPGPAPTSAGHRRPSC
jgi:hypothetical protein